MTIGQQMTGIRLKSHRYLIGDIDMVECNSCGDVCSVRGGVWTKKTGRLCQSCFERSDKV
jgi:hypothetical protein